MILAFVQKETEDGDTSDLVELPGATTIEEGRKVYEDLVVKEELEAYIDERDEAERVIERFEDVEREIQFVELLDVSAREELDIDAGTAAPDIRAEGRRAHEGGEEAAVRATQEGIR